MLFLVFLSVIFIMPVKCCVPGCRTNYDSPKTDADTAPQGQSKISVFKLPKDPVRRQQWVSKIPRKDWTPSDSSGVCELHFKQEDILKSDILPTSQGKILLFTYRPVLEHYYHVHVAWLPTFAGFFDWPFRPAPQFTSCLEQFTTYGVVFFRSCHCSTGKIWPTENCCAFLFSQPSIISIKMPAV